MLWPAFPPDRLDAQDRPVPPTPPGDFDIEEPLEPLAPRIQRTESEQNRLNALAMFAAGRVAQGRDDLPTALRYCQRAHRLDPAAAPILREAVRLAILSNQHAVATRYAVLLAEVDSGDPELARRLAEYLLEEEEWKRALALLERAFRALPDEKPSPEKAAISYDLGRLLFLEKKFSQAAEHFSRVAEALANPRQYGLSDEQVNKLQGEPAARRRLFAECFLAADRFDEALAAYEQTAKDAGDADLFPFFSACVLAKQGRTAEAEQKLRIFLAKPSLAAGLAPYELLAELLAGLNQSDQLIPRLEELHAADRRNLLVTFYLARRYQLDRRWDEAERTYRTILAEHAARPPIEVWQGLADVYRSSDRVDSLWAIVGNVAAQTRSLASLGQSGVDLREDKKTVAALIELAQKNPLAQGETDDGRRYAVALLALAEGRHETADALFEQATNSQPRQQGAELRLAWGMELLLAGQGARAAAALQQGRDPNDSPERKIIFDYYLSAALEAVGDVDKALEAARRAAEATPDSPRLQIRSASILYRAGKFAEAEQALQKLLEKLDSRHESAETRETLRDARLTLSNICALQKKLPQAEEWLEQILDEFPEDVGALNDLGFLWADQGKHLARALGMTQRAVAAEPENAAYRDSLGWALFRLGRYAEAVTELKQAASDEKPDGVVLDHLGDAHWQAGEYAAAREAWRRGARLLEQDRQGDKVREIEGKINRPDPPSPPAAPPNAPS